jgi:flagellar basal-body rod protein FlgC
MNDIASIAASAITSYGMKQAVTANNIANINTPDFKSSSVTMQAVSSGGVSTSVSKGDDTVDISREAVDLISTSHAFTANLKVLKASDDMSKELLSLKA